MSAPDTSTPPVLVQPPVDTRLAQLAAQYDLAKAEATKAADTLKAISDAIKPPRGDSRR